VSSNNHKDIPDSIWQFMNESIEYMMGEPSIPIGYEPYKFPLYIKNKETKLVYKLLMAYEDNPGGLYTRQDDFESRILLLKYQIENDWEILS
jgi:hypothetical protein